MIPLSLRARVGLLVSSGKCLLWLHFSDEETETHRDGHQLAQGHTGGAGLEPMSVGNVTGALHWLPVFCSKPPSRVWGRETWKLGTLGHSPPCLPYGKDRQEPKEGLNFY